MKKYTAAVIAVLICALFCSCAKNEYSFNNKIDGDNNIAVVSFNCAAPWGNVLKKTGSASREKRFASYMNTIHPDSIGTQEMNSSWMKSLERDMPDYDSYGVSRGGDDSEKKSEMNTIFWLRDKYNCIDKGTFWLSETPETQSRYTGAGCNRVCTFVVLESRETGVKYLHANTHLDNASDEARVFGARVVMQKIDELLDTYGDIALVLTGDFNDTIDSPPYLEITRDLSDTISLTGTKEIHSTYTDWGELADEALPIDFIFTNRDAVDYQVLNDTSNGFVSDHFGVYSVISVGQ